MHNMTHCTDHQQLSDFGYTVSDGEATIVDRIYKALHRNAQRIMVASQIRRERLELAQLAEYELRDIGLDSISAAQECNRNYLDIPDNRLTRD